MAIRRQNRVRARRLSNTEHSLRIVDVIREFHMTPGTWTRPLSRAFAGGLLCAAAIAAFSPGCSGGGGASALPRPIGTATSTPSATASAPLDPIKHVVIIIQENRSFNDLFLGFPGAYTSNTGKMSNGVVVTMSPEPLEDKPDLGHGHKAFE